MTTTTKPDSGIAPLLRTLTQDAAAAASSADPRVVADVLLDRLNAKQYRAALAVTLPEFVRHCLSQTRPAPAGDGPVPVNGATRVRNAYAGWMGKGLFTGGEWKFLGDCTADDLHFAAAERYRKATETHAEGDRWEKVALFMEERSVATVGAIGEPEFLALMDGS